MGSGYMGQARHLPPEFLAKIKIKKKYSLSKNSRKVKLR
jgi:hypothetical protein